MTTNTTTEPHRDDYKAALVAMSEADKRAFKEWRDEQGIPRTGAMLKEQWEAAYRRFILGEDEDYTPTGPAPETPETPETPKAETPKAETPETPADINAQLAGLSVVLNPTAVDPLKAAVANLMAERDAAIVRAEQAEQDAQNVVAVPAPQAGEHVACKVKTVSLPEAVGGRGGSARAKATKVTVCDHPGAPKIDPLYLPPQNAPDMVTAIEIGLNVALFGDRGTGKSSFVRWYAAITKRPHFEISCHAEMSADAMFGVRGIEDGKMTWVSGDLLIAIQTPWAVVELSEVNTTRPELIMQVNSILERGSRSIFVGGKRWDVHPTVRFMATSNDNGSGEGAARFAGVRPMNDATRSRFAWFELNLPNKDELVKMVAKAANLPKAAAEIMADFDLRMRKHVKEGECEATPGMRAMVAWSELVLAGVPSRDAFSYAAEHVGTSDDAAVWRQDATNNFDHRRFEALCAGKADPDPTAGDATPEGPTRAGFGEL